jgi:predicted RNA-binding Zn-ribbon protein involved in translation (DUF1610 family)
MPHSAARIPRVPVSRWLREARLAGAAGTAPYCQRTWVSQTAYHDPLRTADRLVAERAPPSGHSGRVFTCPVCGAAELSRAPYETWPPPSPEVLEPPYEDQLGRASYQVCPSCGYEFGNDDNPGTAAPVSFEVYRESWEAEGSPRFREQT